MTAIVVYLFAVYAELPTADPHSPNPWGFLGPHV